MPWWGWVLIGAGGLVGLVVLAAFAYIIALWIIAQRNLR